MRLWLAGTVALALLLAGCGEPSGTRFTGEFERVGLSAAPAGLKAEYERLKAIPGLLVLREKGRTFLMLTAGRQPELGWEVEVLEVRRLSLNGKDVRVLARLRRGSGSGQYPAAVLRLDTDENLSFAARFSVRSEVPLELSGVNVEAE